VLCWAGLDEAVLGRVEVQRRAEPFGLRQLERQQVGRVVAAGLG
jgi:hypothetical protein